MTHSEKLVSELEKKGAGVKDGYLTAFAYNLHGDEKLVRIDGTGVIYRDRLCLYEDGKEIKTSQINVIILSTFSPAQTLKVPIISPNTPSISIMGTLIPMEYLAP